MASPAVRLYRLPSEAEVKRILAAAAKKDAAKTGAPALVPLPTEEAKARRNLYKGLTWTFQGLAPDLQLEANKAYQKSTRMPAANLGTDFSGEKGAISVDRVLAAMSALVSVSKELQHSGHDRLIALDKPQLTAIDSLLHRLSEHVKQLDKGDHDGLIRTVFQDLSATPKSDAEIRNQVIRVFKLALASVRELRRSSWSPLYWKSTEIVRDTYGEASHTGGLGGVGSMKLPDAFFSKSEAEKEAVLLHEGTHTIDDALVQTNDLGGYIGFSKFQTSTIDERTKNASHYEAVIRLINNEVLPVPSAALTASEVELAQKAVQAAWTKGLFFYSSMQEMGTSAISDQVRLYTLYVISRIFGLGGYQGVPEKGPYPRRSVTAADLAAVENRVGKLSSLLEPKALKAAVDELTRTGTTLSRDAVLLKLVEREGTIRKTTAPQKTVDMILLLADFGLAQVNAFFQKYPAR